jgi:hypothetical protein
MAGYPKPEEWLTCDVPALREAAKTIVDLVRMRAFHMRPPGDAQAWERVHRLLVGPDGAVTGR